MDIGVGSNDPDCVKMFGVGVTDGVGVCVDVGGGVGVGTADIRNWLLHVISCRSVSGVPHLAKLRQKYIIYNFFNNAIFYLNTYNLFRWVNEKAFVVWPTLTLLFEMDYENGYGHVRFVVFFCRM